jgi:hypothetical protein
VVWDGTAAMSQYDGKADRVMFGGSPTLTLTTK